MKSFAVVLAFCVVGALATDDLCENQENDAFFARPDSCSGYYQCHFGELSEFDCGENFHFSMKDQKCKEAHHVPCFEGKRLCDDDHLGEYFQEPEVCGGYFLCSGGDEAEYFTCAEGLHYNPETHQCDFPYNVNCNETPMDNTYCKQYSDNGKKNHFFVAHPHMCSRYYYCYNGNQAEFTCPEDFHFDPFNNYCARPTEAGCRATPECPTQGFHVFPHPVDCRKYVFCVDGHAHVQSCGPELFFDYQASKCRAGDESVCFSH